MHYDHDDHEHAENAANRALLREFVGAAGSTFGLMIPMIALAVTRLVLAIMGTALLSGWVLSLALTYWAVFLLRKGYTVGQSRGRDRERRENGRHEIHEDPEPVVSWGTVRRLAWGLGLSALATAALAQWMPVMLAVVFGLVLWAGGTVILSLTNGPFRRLIRLQEFMHGGDKPTWEV